MLAVFRLSNDHELEPSSDMYRTPHARVGYSFRARVFSEDDESGLLQSPFGLLPVHINRECRSSGMPSFARNRPRRPRRRNSRAKRIRIDSVSVARHRARAADLRKTDHRAGNVLTDVRYNPRIAGLLNFAFVFDVFELY